MGRESRWDFSQEGSPKDGKVGAEGAAQIPEKIGTQAALLRKKIKRMLLLFPFVSMRPDVPDCFERSGTMRRLIDFLSYLPRLSDLPVTYPPLCPPCETVLKS